MAKPTIRIEITGDARKAQKALADTEEALGDVEGAADKAGDQFDRTGDRIEKALVGASRAATDRLDSLSDSLRGKFGGAGDKAADVADRLGDRFRGLARDTGAALDDVDGAVGQTVDRLDKARDGVAKAFDGMQKAAADKLGELTKELRGKFGPAGDAAADVADTLVDKFKGMGPAATIAAGGVGAAAAAIAAFAASSVKFTVDLAKRTAELQAVTNLSAEEASLLIGVADRLGVETDELTDQFGSLLDQIANNRAEFEELGVQIVEDQQGRVDAAASFEAIAKAIAAQRDPAKKAQLANMAFGEQWRKNDRLMRAIADGSLADITEELRKQGRILNQTTVDAAFAYEAALKDLTSSADGLKTEVGSGLLPALTSVAKAADTVADAVAGASDAAKRAALNTVPYATEVRSLIGLLSRSSDSAAKAKVEIDAKAEADRRAAAAALALQQNEGRKNAELERAEAAAERARKATEDYFAALDNGTSVQFTADRALDAFAEGLADIVSLEEEHRGNLDRSTKAGRDNAEAFRSQVERAQEYIGSLIEAGATQQQVEDAAETMAQQLDTAGQEAGFSAEEVATFTSKLREVPESTRSVINVDSDDAETRMLSVQERLDSFDGRVVNVGVRVNEVTGDVVARDAEGRAVQFRAKGGPVRAGDPYVVGEDGPELIVPKQAGTVVPLTRTGGRPAPMMGGGAPVAVHQTITVSIPDGSPSEWVEGLQRELRWQAAQSRRQLGGIGGGVA